MENNQIAKNVKFILLLISFMLMYQFSFAQTIHTNKENGIRPFIAYDFGEAAFNKFQSLSGEIGIRFSNNHMFRFVHMNIKLTEQHLSSSFAGAVDGDDVKGSLFGFEAFYDFPVAFKTLYVCPSIGYYKGSYEHTVLDESIEMDYSATIGLAVSYREINLFGLKGLYYNLSVPMRLVLSPTEETKLGDTVISNNTYGQNIWFFVGYEF